MPSKKSSSTKPVKYVLVYSDSQEATYFDNIEDLAGVMKDEIETAVRYGEDIPFTLFKLEKSVDYTYTQSSVKING